MDKPVSDRKLAANRENAKKSTGPRTSKGKAIASLNAMTHGIFARHAVATGPPLMESPGEFLSLLESLRTHFNPQGALEDAIIQQISDVKWKQARLARYEAAGVTERLYSSVSASSRKMEESRWTDMHLRKTAAQEDPGTVDADTLRNQIDLVERLSGDDGPIEEDEQYLKFVFSTSMVGLGESSPSDAEDQISKTRDHLRGLSKEHRSELANAYRSQMATLLKGMYEKRANSVTLESALDRSLVPDEAELQKIMRYSTYLSRQEERYIEMLLKLQDARRDREREGHT